MNKVRLKHATPFPAIILQATDTGIGAKTHSSGFQLALSFFTELVLQHSHAVFDARLT